MRAAVYVRQSLDRSGEALAVGRQEAECRELAEANGWTVERIYSDNDRSATSGKPRPAWTELLADLAAGRYDVLVCWHTDRLYRRLRDLVDIVELAEARSLRIASVKAADLDLSTPAGRMLAGILGSAASYEVEQKSARQVAANRAKAKRGEVGWVRRPYGYERRGGKIVTVAREAKEVRRAAESVLGGTSLAAVVADLNARGVTTSLGSPWNVTSLRRVLLNPRHAGRAVHLGTDYGPGKWPAILPTETHDALRERLTDPARRTHAGDTRTKYLLTGIVRCGRCGERMFATPAGSPTGGRWLIYRCPTTHLARRLDLVDEVVEGAILGRLSRPDAADLLRPDADLDGIRSRLTELRDRRDNLATLLGEGLLSASAVREQAAKLTEAIGAAEAELSTASGDGPVSSLLTAVDARAAWDTLTLSARREVVRTLLDVTILPAGRGARFDPATVSIEWRS